MMLSDLRRKVLNVYNDMPLWAKNLCAQAGRVVPPRYIFGRTFSAMLGEIRKTEHWSKKDLDSLQLQELRKILSHSYRTTEYYRTQMSDRGITERVIIDSPEAVLSDLGFTDKRLVMDNFDQFLSDTKDEILRDYTSTGGTSGEPFCFYIDSSRSAKEWAFFVDQWSRVGFDICSRRATFRGSRIRSKKGWEDDRITRERKFSSFELTDGYLNRIWPALYEFRPEFIYAYPSTAISLCQFMEKHQMVLPSCVKAILIGSENIYDGQSEYIEKVSGKKIFAWYGHSEKVVLAGQCEYTPYYHAYPQYGYVEFINDTGKPAKQGEFAEIVGTGFVNTVMPFIRYRTGDYCTYLGDHCPKCGRNYHIFSNVRGRWTQEVLYGVKGNSICMSAINAHSNSLQNVFRFQFLQETPGKALLRLVPSDGFSERDKKAIEKDFNNKLGENVVVKAVIVDDIPLTQRGKFKFIDQRIKEGAIHL